MNLAFWIVVSWLLLAIGVVVSTREFYRRRITKQRRLGQHLHDKWIASLRQEQYLIEEIEDLTTIRDASLDCIERIRGPLDKRQEPAEINEDV